MEPTQNVEILSNLFFPCGVYSFNDKSYIEEISSVAEEYVPSCEDGCQIINDVYPVVQTGNFASDSRIENFRSVLGHACWEILNQQGYNMDLYDVSILELWMQDHHHYSGHDVHIHGNGSQLCGFYFIDGDYDSVRAVIHDPRQVKVYANLPERDADKVTLASTSINFIPEPGTFMIMNSWMPHSFTRNKSDKTFRFIHFNIGVSPHVNVTSGQTPEVI